MQSVLQPVDPNERYKVRRRDARERRRRRRLAAAGLLLSLIAAGVVGGAVATHVDRGGTPESRLISLYAPRRQVHAYLHKSYHAHAPDG